MKGSIDDLKDLLAEKAGPYGRMVIEEKMESLGISGNPSSMEMSVLIEESVISAIADSSKHDEVIEELKEKLL